MSIFKGFEGYRDPTKEDLTELLKRAPIVLDTNVLLNLYGLDEPARELAFSMFEWGKGRVWVPHQVMLEFWRRRVGVIQRLDDTEDPIEKVRKELMQIVNSLTPESRPMGKHSEMKDSFNAKLDELADLIRDARGKPLDIELIVTDACKDPVLSRLAELLEGQVGSPFSPKEYPQMLQEGHRRFEAKIPPGFADAKDKIDQKPEEGTGDFLMWEQTLRHMEDEGQDSGFVLVTNDKKSDWRPVPQGAKKLAKPHPTLIEESLSRTGGEARVLLQEEFFDLMSEILNSDEAVSDRLLSASRHQATEQSSSWSPRAYRELLERLRDRGNDAQADVIAHAAHVGNVLVRREEVLEVAGYDPERTLQRFSLPATRVADDLVEEGIAEPNVRPPLEAVYEIQNGSRAIGYRVPPEFVDGSVWPSQAEGTWIDSARAVAETDPEKWWRVAELVSAIKERGLRDTSNALTPEATLRRDLNLRANNVFEKSDDGSFKLR